MEMIVCRVVPTVLANSSCDIFRAVRSSFNRFFKAMSFISYHPNVDQNKIRDHNCSAKRFQYCTDQYAVRSFRDEKLTEIEHACPRKAYCADSVDRGGMPQNPFNNHKYDCYGARADNPNPVRFIDFSSFHFANDVFFALYFF